jgi:hypothetical protein
MKEISMNSPYDYEIPIPPFHLILPRKGVHGIKAIDGRGFKTIEECVEACKAECKKFGVDYNDHNVKLFMTDTDGKWEVTEEGELAG